MKSVWKRISTTDDKKAVPFPATRKSCGEFYEPADLTSSLPSRLRQAQFSESGLEALTSQTNIRRRNAVITPSNFTLRRRNGQHSPSIPNCAALNLITEDSIYLTIQKNGLPLLHKMIKLMDEKTVREIVNPILLQIDHCNFSYDQIEARNVDKDEVIDLDVPVTAVLGQNIVINIKVDFDMFVGSPEPIVGSGEMEANSSSITSVQQCLTHFENHGITPLMNSETGYESGFQPQLQLPQLPKSWREMVKPEIEKSLTEKRGWEEDLQQYIWELIQTEHSHIHQLQIVVNVFMRALDYIMSAGLMREVNYQNIFGSMKNILTAHESFWHTTLQPCWEEAYAGKSIFQFDLLLSNFVDFSTQFEIYEQHCIFEAENLKELNDATKNADFKSYLQWCESRPECARLRLKDYLAKPMQRLTKYPLLLKNIFKIVQDPDQRNRMEEILTEVEEFVHAVNTILQKQEEVDKVKNIMTQIDSYSAISYSDSDKYLHQYMQVDLMRPMPGTNVCYSRMLYHQDVMKYKDDNGRDLYQVLIFTDMLLLAKSFKRGAEGKLDIVKPPYRIDKIKLKPKGQLMFFVVVVNEFGLATAAFTLKADNQHKATAFRGKFEEAQTYYDRLVTENATSTLRHANRLQSHDDCMQMVDLVDAVSRVYPTSRSLQLKRYSFEDVLTPDRSSYANSEDSLTNDSRVDNTPLSDDAATVAWPSKRESCLSSSSIHLIKEVHSPSPLLTSLSNEDVSVGQHRKSYYEESSTAEHSPIALNESSKVYEITIPTIHVENDSDQEDQKDLTHDSKRYLPIISVTRSSEELENGCLSILAETQNNDEKQILQPDHSGNEIEPKDYLSDEGQDENQLDQLSLTPKNGLYSEFTSTKTADYSSSAVISEDPLVYAFKRYISKTPRESPTPGLTNSSGVTLRRFDSDKTSTEYAVMSFNDSRMSTPDPEDFFNGPMVKLSETPSNFFGNRYSSSEILIHEETDTLTNSSGSRPASVTGISRPLNWTLVDKKNGSLRKGQLSFVSKGQSLSMSSSQLTSETQQDTSTLSVTQKLRRFFSLQKLLKKGKTRNQSEADMSTGSLASSDLSFNGADTNSPKEGKTHVNGAKHISEPFLNSNNGGHSQGPTWV